MKYLLLRVAFVLTVAALFSSCEKTENLVIDYKHDYYPDEMGHYVVYDVDSIIFDEFQDRSDTFHYQKKYVVDSSFIDNIGREAFRLIRYHRADSTQGWTLADVWWAVNTGNSLEVVEENQRFVKLVFPPKEDQTWEGNKYLVDSLDGNEWSWVLGECEYTVTALDVPATVNGLTFDSTITVVHKSDSTLIDKVISEEQYAKGVGMIYKRFMALNKAGDISRPWTDPETGSILIMRVAEYGDE